MVEVLERVAPSTLWNSASIIMAYTFYGPRAVSWEVGGGVRVARWRGGANQSCLLFVRTREDFEDGVLSVILFTVPHVHAHVHAHVHVLLCMCNMCNMSVSMMNLRMTSMHNPTATPNGSRKRKRNRARALMKLPLPARRVHSGLGSHETFRIRLYLTLHAHSLSTRSFNSVSLRF